MLIRCPFLFLFQTLFDLMKRDRVYRRLPHSLSPSLSHWADVEVANHRAQGRRGACPLTFDLLHFHSARPPHHTHHSLRNEDKDRCPPTSIRVHACPWS